jgi:diguanylate cyclase (GGDEF)-like protein
MTVARNGRAVDARMIPPADHEAERLTALRSLGILGSPPDPDLDALCRLAAELLGTPTVAVSLVDAERQWFVAGVGTFAVSTPRDAAFCNHAIRSDEILVVEDAGLDRRFARNPLVTGAPGIRFYAGAPLSLRHGVRLGTLCLIDTQPRALDDAGRRRLRDFAALAVSHLRLQETEVALQARENELRRANRDLGMAESWAKVGHWRIAFPDERITWSDGMYPIFGRPPEAGAPTKQAVLDTFHPEDREDVRVRLERTAMGGEDYEHRPRFIRTDGEVRVALAHAVAERDATGEVVGLFGACMDVTDLVRVEEDLRATSALLRATLEHMDQGLLMVDAARRVRVHNRRALELLDLPAELLRGEPSFEAVRRHQVARGETAELADAPHPPGPAQGREADSRIHERERPEGTVLEIRTVPLDGGGMVRTYTDITARKRAEAQIAHMAHHDPLTGLANRARFRECLDRRLAEVGRQGATCAVLCLDLDRFKAVNDTLGHPAGDALLRAVAARMRGRLRKQDILARLGGDEFAVLTAPVAHPAQAAAVAARLVGALHAPFRIEGHEITVGTSIGIALAPEHGRDGDTLFKNADLALYAAKDSGRDGYRFYTPAMGEAASGRQRLELDLRGALARDQFELHYQPVVDTRSLAVTGFEALIRWTHPTRGRVPPDAFIPVAEETGLIVPVGDWVLRKACEDAVRWPGDVRLAVNVSAVQLMRPGLVEGVVATLAATGLAAGRLELEITETALLRDSPAVLACLHALRGLGVRVALDDFGTGYSSLSYLRKFPLDRIKIDRSFVEAVDEPGTAAIVGAIAGLGASLGAAVTAEGVETERQLGALRLSGCGEAQGYLFGKPAPAAEAAAFLRRGAGTRAA